MIYQTVHSGQIAFIAKHNQMISTGPFAHILFHIFSDIKERLNMPIIMNVSICWIQINVQGDGYDSSSSIHLGHGGWLVAQGVV